MSGIRHKYRCDQIPRISAVADNEVVDTKKELANEAGCQVQAVKPDGVCSCLCTEEKSGCRLLKIEVIQNRLFSIEQTTQVSTCQTALRLRITEIRATRRSGPHRSGV